jgi:hypothetical protein
VRRQRRKPSDSLPYTPRRYIAKLAFSRFGRPPGKLRNHTQVMVLEPLDADAALADADLAQVVRDELAAAVGSDAM